MKDTTEQEFTEHLALCTREFVKKLQDKVGKTPYVIIALGPGDLVGMMGNIGNQQTRALLLAALVSLDRVEPVPNVPAGDLS